MRSIKTFLVCIAGLALSQWSEVQACSCFPSTTLEQHYNNADNVLVAKILGCEPSYLSADGRCSLHRFSFETIENLKGSNAVVRAQRDEMVRSTCDTSLKVGEMYLLFLRDGRTQLCSGTVALSGDIGARRMQDIKMLRSYRDGEINRIENPWYFSDTGSECAIDHQLDATAHIRLRHQYGHPPQQQTTRPIEHNPHLTLRLVQPFEVAGTTLLEVNGADVPLTRIDLEPRPRLKLSLEIANGQAASMLLDAVSARGVIIVSGHRARAGSPAEPFSVAADMSQFADVVDQFKSCIAAH